MKTQIEIYQVRGGNVHIVLRGRVGDGPDDPDVFARYLEVCQAFAPGLAPLPEVITAAFDGEDEARSSFAAPR